MVSVYLDQLGTQVGREVERLSRLPSLSLGPPISSAVLYSENKDCPAYTWAASHNRHSEIGFLVDSVFSKLESLDRGPDFLSVVADASQGLGSGLSSGLLQELRDLLPSMSLRSVLLLPPNQAFAGPGIYNACLAAQMSLNFADLLILRGADDALHLASSLGTGGSTASVNTSNSSANTSSLSWKDAHCVLACDLLFACSLYNNSCSSSSSTTTNGTHAHEIWPCLGKIVDVRTSMYRLLKEINRKERKGTTGSNYSPLRAMATNLHSLHLCSGLHGSSLAVERASIRTCQTSSSSSSSSASGLRVGPGEYTSADIKTALDWACPRVRWPVGVGRGNTRGGSGTVGVGVRVEGEGASAGGGVWSVAAVAYTCPYAAHTLQQTARQAALLLSKRAFLQRFFEFGLEESELRDCFESLSTPAAASMST